MSVTVEQPFGDAARVRVTGFRDRLEDEIDGFVFDADAAGFTAVNTNGESRRDGDRSVACRRAQRGDAAAASITPISTRRQPGNGSHEDELRRPRNSGRIVVDYAALPDRLTLQVGAAYVGDHDDDDFGDVSRAARQPRRIHAATLHRALSH